MVRELWDWKRNGGGAQNRSMPDAEAALKGMAEKDKPKGDNEVREALRANTAMMRPKKKKNRSIRKGYSHCCCCR